MTGVSFGTKSTYGYNPDGKVTSVKPPTVESIYIRNPYGNTSR